MRTPVRPRHLSVAVVLALVACGDDPAAVELAVAFEGVPTAGVAGGEAVSGLAVVVTDQRARPVADVGLTLTATGGGVVAPTTLVTGADGRATFTWTPGVLPIVNTLRAADADGRAAAEATLDVTTAAALAPEAFGDVDAFLSGQRVAGSTEDLAFDPRPGGRGLVAGADTMLIALDPSGAVTPIATTGEAFGRVLGLAFDHDGRLYVADGGRDMLLRVDVDGAVSMVADRDGDEPFASPNDVAVGPDGTVYLSDTCTGKFLAIDPATGAVTSRVTLDPATDGGPNGVVVGPAGALWVTTENTALFCGHDVGLTTALGGLYRVPVLDGGALGQVQPVARGVGVFGDGLAFDGLGNLYVIFDTVVELALDETIVFVLPSGGTALTRVASARGKVWANLAFAPDAYGSTTMYLALLAVPPFTPADARGIERVRVDVPGAPLPPSSAGP
ncbi:MAG: hypothetical protein IT385_10265 [Deltaproteobacteria bacterium]|nr:hypothetical protein [Deltaproteobacteria bacterium]